MMNNIIIIFKSFHWPRSLVTARCHTNWQAYIASILFSPLPPYWPWLSPFFLSLSLYLTAVFHCFCWVGKSMLSGVGVVVLVVVVVIKPISGHQFYLDVTMLEFGQFIITFIIIKCHHHLDVDDNDNNDECCQSTTTAIAKPVSQHHHHHHNRHRLLTWSSSTSHFVRKHLCLCVCAAASAGHHYYHSKLIKLSLSFTLLPLSPISASFAKCCLLILLHLLPLLFLLLLLEATLSSQLFLLVMVVISRIIVINAVGLLFWC